MPAGPDHRKGSGDMFVNRELSWLAFSRRVLAQVDREDLPLMERVKFAGIMGMLHDEFFMKRMSGLKRQMQRRPDKLSIDGRTPSEEFKAARDELLEQAKILEKGIARLRRDLGREGVPVLGYGRLRKASKQSLRAYFRDSVQPILTPLAVDAEHPFPFISDGGLNLAVRLEKSSRDKGKGRFVRIKVPDNRPRWVPIDETEGSVPLEEVIAANLDLMFPGTEARDVHFFRVTRGAEGERPPDLDEYDVDRPGSVVSLVSSELKARKFAGVVRLQVMGSMPEDLEKWLRKQLGVGVEDVYRSKAWLRISDLMSLEAPGRQDLQLAPLEPTTHPRLRRLDPGRPEAIFEEISRGDILLHHPYHSFDTSVLRMLESAAMDPLVLAIKLTIYRTSKDSPIVRALVEASRRGKQVAVLVEITARFDEAPNIAWGSYLEQEGVHVAYGVEKLKTHVKLALVVREEAGKVRRYAHVGTGNYHTGTARIYEDLGLLTCEPRICEDAAAVFNELTGASSHHEYDRMLVAPRTMGNRFADLIRREAEHALAGRRSGIKAKLNQLQDPDIIRELYAASAAGVPIDLNVRGLCCLRPGVEGLSENIKLFAIVDRFLEHSRIYRFENGGDPEFYIGSADWMRRNLKKRVETIAPVPAPAIRDELEEILQVYERDNCSAWDGLPDGSYARRTPAEGEERRAAQQAFIDLASR